MQETLNEALKQTSMLLGENELPSVALTDDNATLYLIDDYLSKNKNNIEHKYKCFALTSCKNRINYALNGIKISESTPD